MLSGGRNSDPVIMPRVTVRNQRRTAEQVNQVTPCDRGVGPM